jgi:hypothetical protein
LFVGLILILFCDCFIFFPDLSVIFLFRRRGSVLEICPVLDCSLFPSLARSILELSVPAPSLVRTHQPPGSALDFCFTRRPGFCSFSHRSSGPVCVWLAYALDFPAAVEVFVRPKVVPSVVRCCYFVWTEAEICLCGFFFLVFMCFVGSPSSL